MTFATSHSTSSNGSHEANLLRARAELEIRRRVQAEGLLAYVPRLSPRFQAPQHLARVAELYQRIARGEQVFAVVNLPPRHGKAIADETPMLTRRGWVRAGDVVVGDDLVGADGGWTKVLGVYPQGEVDLFEVTFSGKVSLRTCGEHRWSVRQRYSGPPTVRTTSELASDLTEADGRSKWRIPIVAPLAGDRSSFLPIDPYVLGSWLGDGTSRRGEITTMDPEIVGAFRAAGFETSYEYPAGRATTYGVPGLGCVLRSLGILGRDRKRIPSAYLDAPAEARLALLQGLADTDGTVAKDGSAQSICTTSDGLADDIKVLICGLGGVYAEHCGPAAGKTAHNISFRLPSGMSGFRLDRKASRLNAESPKNRPRRFVKSIARAGRGRATCFAVEAADHLFCAGRDLVVTHNTELELHGVPWLLRQRPEFELCFAGYGAPFARKKSRRARDLTQRAGVPIDRGAKAVTDWRTGVEGGGMWATSVGGAVNGEGFHVALVDDPIKGRREAESAKYREAILEWFRADLITRLHPRGSCIVTQTRWHPDDLAGVLIAEGWECIRVPAIDEVVGDNGNVEERALWPERYDLEALRAIRRRVGEYNWASLYQGLPRPRGGALFREPTFYDVAPNHGRYFIGVDFAYTAKTSADYSTAVVLRESQGKLYVIEVVRMQVAAPEFGAALAALKKKYAGATVHGYVAGPEKGTVDLLNRAHPGLNIQTKPAVADKFVRAQGAAADWNAGDMPVPSGRVPGCAVCSARQCGAHKAPEWLDVYLGEVCGFTGVGDVHDDLVDATAAARDAAKGPHLSAGSLLSFGAPAPRFS